MYPLVRKNLTSNVIFFWGGGIELKIKSYYESKVQQV